MRRGGDHGRRTVRPLRPATSRSRPRWHLRRASRASRWSLGSSRPYSCQRGVVVSALCRARIATLQWTARFAMDTYANRRRSVPLFSLPWRSSAPPVPHPIPGDEPIRARRISWPSHGAGRALHPSPVPWRSR